MSLPPIQALPVSAETRLSYVLRHFRLAYESVHLPSIGYYPVGPEDAQIVIGSGEDEFFALQRPYPHSFEINWRQWRGKSIPFFFDSDAGEPLIELLPEGKSFICPDIISAAFYLLSGWQEYFSEERDQHGRFPYSASVQSRYGFVTVPVVNYYFDILKTAVEHVTGQPLRPRRWANGASWAAFITHDIDNLYSAWKAPANAALRQGKLLSFGRQLWQHFTKPDAWDNLAQVQQTVASYGAKSTFFFLPEHRKAANGTPNADYKINHSKLINQIRQLFEDGSEIAVHGSLSAGGDDYNLVIETATVRKIAGLPLDSGTYFGNRFHYLRWEPRFTPILVEELTSVYDSTLGFAEHFGFRNSYCLPFYPFNFQTGEAHDFLEIPLNVMDATLYHPRYLQLEPAEILPALTPMFQEIERFGGVCTVLWHNENFDPANHHNGPREFHTIMEYLRGRHVTFVNGSDICAQRS
ncbi:hypothetical protein LRS06_18095 [Hymenobacter sp. J193]|uniref:DUF7033 domain-containing protein n=1 Tax=Hymenobacter sp. J193 TaxID=2898429 RepID=UPI0021518400|nr:hypothetical protein [Hymenobacter sp. J193]MCR5889649.1 hypothetical protein [Hymenobacter sp. J193]